MNDPAERPLNELIEAALQRAVRQAILEHARTGDAIVLWRDGKVVWVSASEVRSPASDTPKSAN
jgi:hypothetical protein